MTEEKKELLKEKLKQFFDNKLDSLTKKIENDINLIEKVKYYTYDNIIMPYLQLSQLEKEEKEKNDDKEKHKDKSNITEIMVGGNTEYLRSRPHSQG